MRTSSLTYSVVKVAKCLQLALDNRHRISGCHLWVGCPLEKSPFPYFSSQLSSHHFFTTIIGIRLKVKPAKPEIGVPLYLSTATLFTYILVTRVCSIGGLTLHLPSLRRRVRLGLSGKKLAVETTTLSQPEIDRLVARLCVGEVEALETLYDCYAGQVYGFLLRWLNRG